MYVCMHVCMYVYMYVCMYVCTYVCCSIYDIPAYTTKQLLSVCAQQSLPSGYDMQHIIRCRVEVRAVSHMGEDHKVHFNLVRVRWRKQASSFLNLCTVSAAFSKIAVHGYR